MSYEPPKDGFRTFLTIWVTQSVSVFGSSLSFFAINIWLTQTLYPAPEQKPALAAALSAISLAHGLPVLLFNPVAGALADRHDRKRLMIAANVIEGILSLLLLFLIATGRLELNLLLVIMVFFSLAGICHFAAFDSSYAMLVPKELLPRANGMMQTMWSLSGIIAPAVAATLIALPAFARQGSLPGWLASFLSRMADGTPIIIGIDALTFFLAAAVLLTQRVPSPRRADLVDGKAKPSIFADVASGARYIWHRRPLLWLLGTFTVVNFCAPIGIYMPLLVKFNLAADWSARGFTLETALALLNTAGSVGGVTAGLLVTWWGGLKERRIFGIILPMIGAGVALALLGQSQWLYVTAGLAMLISGTLPVMNSHSQAIWQTQVPRELQGRVFSVRRMIAQITMPLGTAFAGWAGGQFDPGNVVTVLGTVMAVFCLIQAFNPYLRRVEDREWLEGLAARAEAGD